MKIYNMEIHALKARILWLLSIFILVSITAIIVFYIIYNNVEFNDMWYHILIILIGIILLLIVFAVICHNVILIEYDMIRMLPAPLIMPKFGFSERSKKDYWNLRVKIPDIKRIEIRNLARHEKWNLGSKFLFRKYLVIETQKGQYKYMPIGTFSKKQINILLDYINNFEYDEERK